MSFYLILLQRGQVYYKILQLSKIRKYRKCYQKLGLPFITKKWDSIYCIERQTLQSRGLLLGGKRVPNFLDVGSLGT